MSGRSDEPSGALAPGEPTYADPDEQHTVDVLGPTHRRARDDQRGARPDPARPAEPAPLEGMRVGRYQLLEMVGLGGMGMVWGAWDPELERRVALKLMRASGHEARERMLAEGQALAKLSHPNVVPIYDVGVMGEQVYLIMEWVRGATLRGFARAAPTLRALLEAYRQAGEGLAAAHRAGIVHRDFKPDNVIRGEDGRVRVLDFGLAFTAATGAPAADLGAAGGAAGAPDASERTSATDGTSQRHGVVGTPRYMAPEQKRGEATTAASDQYAFCVAVAEAVGEHAAARRGKVPGWITALTTRGLAEQPSQRFASMQALLEALARDPRTVWRRRAAVLAVGAAAATAFAVGRGHGDAQAVAPCAGSLDEIAPVWAAPQRVALTEHLSALGPLAADQVASLAGALDDYRARWVDEHRRACLARERRELTPTLYERRLACLARARSALATVAEMLTNVPVERLSSAVVTPRDLPPPAACATADDSAVTPPAPEVAAQVAAVIPELERTRVLTQTLNPEALARAQSVVSAARTTGYTPLIARALLEQGRAFLALSPPQRGGAALSFFEALSTGLLAFDEPLALEAYARVIWVTQAADVPADWSVMRLLAQRTGARGRFGSALMLNNLGSNYFQRKQHDKARALLLAALDETDLATRPLPTDASANDLELLAILKNLSLIEHDVARRRDYMERVVSSYQHTVGRSHPDTYSALEQLGMLTNAPTRAREIIEEACLGYARWRLTRWQTICAYEAGWLADELGDREAALGWMKIARTYQRSEKAPREKGALASAYVALYDPRPAQSPLTLDELWRLAEVARGRRDWWHAIDVADALALAARLAHQQGDRGAELHARREAMRALEAIDEPTYERRVARARAELALLDPDRAHARRLAELADAWYRDAGGYDAERARLAPLLASPAPPSTRSAPRQRTHE